MDQDLNLKLAAVLDKHPEIRPTRIDRDINRKCELRYEDGHWDFWHGVSLRLTKDDEDAHALIFRAMVENLPRGARLSPVSSGWTVEVPPEIPEIKPTALEALCSFWNSRTHDADAMGGKAE